VSVAPYTVSVAGRRLAITGDSGITAFAPAFAGVLDGSGGHPEAVLEVETADDPAGTAPWRDYASGSHRSCDGALAVVRREPSIVQTFRPGAEPRLGVAASPEGLACGDLRAQPAYHAIAAWLAGPTMQLVHGAAVALDGRGVLLVGVSGRGKSTTAMVCAQAGFSLLGDDLCIVEAGSDGPCCPPRVHGLYATVKLNPDSRDRLGGRDWQVLGITPKGKDAVALPPGIRFERQVPLVAVVGVRAGGPAPGVLRPVRASAAVGMLAATALPMAIGSGTPSDWLRTAASIARTVPAYELGLSWDLDAVVAALRSAVEIGAARNELV
jgi:hypothetical protein